jgi:thiamine biosynthesis protein ThiS
LTVNGAPHEHRGDATIAALLAELGADPGRVAIMLNGRILRGADRDAVRLAAGDEVEVLVFAGGG